MINIALAALITLASAAIPVAAGYAGYVMAENRIARECVMSHGFAVTGRYEFLCAQAAKPELQ